MVICIKTVSKTLDVNQLDVEILRLIPATGETITIHEIAFALPTDGRIDSYIAESKVDEIDCKMVKDVNYPVVVNRELVAGQPFVVKGSSAGAGDFKVLVVYDWAKV